MWRSGSISTDLAGHQAAFMHRLVARLARGGGITFVFTVCFEEVFMWCDGTEIPIIWTTLEYRVGVMMIRRHQYVYVAAAICNIEELQIVHSTDFYGCWLCWISEWHFTQFDLLNHDVCYGEWSVWLSFPHLVASLLLDMTCASDHHPWSSDHILRWVAWLMVFSRFCSCLVALLGTPLCLQAWPLHWQGWLGFLYMQGVLFVRRW